GRAGTACSWSATTGGLRGNRDSARARTLAEGTRSNARRRRARRPQRGGARPWRPGRRAPGREDRVRTGGTGAGGGVPAGRGGRCSGASAARRRDGRRATLMLFRVDPEQQRLRSVPSDWLPQELELEKLIVTTEDGETPILDDAVFGEQLLVLRRQVSTRTGKRADILALDRAGRLVVVELKRNAGRL